MNHLNRSIIIFTVLIFHSLFSDVYAGQYDCMRDFPLFDYRAEGNKLPWGDYVMIRSFRETTQIIICRSYYHYTVYTDRNNLKEGDITASGYTELGQIISSPKIPSQFEFDTMLRDYILNGVSSDAGVMFYGVQYFMDRINSDKTSIHRFSEEYIMKIEEAGILTEITVDARWKKLVVKRTGAGTEASRCPSVYIDQTLDKTLKRVITEFAYKIRKR
ncbi:MAG TPA: hypothetical protein P5120_10145 [Spirochaetota bacterium]|nr:hypothetical protein [Spirochaetota bacterium]HPF07547.1 hypothetical protein [Spirochaetota bacterium]HPJ42536.1 hypothetical protein [Spirochaetota bacterium]HPR37476.1 hypothetical protein [Spirochaetota bacterium]HRX47869.1 hypothetical protein [Spirochaetota bacterium]